MDPMQQSCPVCRARFTLEDAVEDREGRGVFCPGCNSLVSGKISSQARWFYARQQRKFGPYSSAQMKQFAASGKLQPSDMIWQMNSPKWVTAGSVKGLFPNHQPETEESFRDMLFSRSASDSRGLSQADRLRWFLYGFVAATLAVSLISWALFRNWPKEPSPVAGGLTPDRPPATSLKEAPPRGLASEPASLPAVKEEPKPIAEERPETPPAVPENPATERKPEPPPETKPEPLPPEPKPKEPAPETKPTEKPATKPDPAKPKITSPTGRTPKLIWTPERQAVWNKMRAENHPLWQLIKERAEGVDAGKHEIMYAVLAYQISGDERYAAKAMTQIGGSGEELTKADGNWYRQYSMEQVIFYDWLKPYLDKDPENRRKPFVNWLNDLADFTFTEGRMGQHHRLGDSDEITGVYFFYAFLSLATAEDNPRAPEFLKHKLVGGLEAKEASWTTMRNVIRYYAEWVGTGGEWPEGSEYNLNTMVLMMMGYEGVRTATGTDHFPELTAFIKKAALAQVYSLSPDLAQEYQWGDVQHPHYIHTHWRPVTMAALASLTKSEPEIGPYVQKALLDLLYAHKYTPLSARFYIFFDPYASTKDWRTLPKGFFAPGQGLVYFHDGWKPADSFLGLHFAQRTGVDHHVYHVGNFQLYRKGEWAITHPIGYNYNEGDAVNAMLIAGLSAMGDRAPVAHEFGPDGTYCYFAGKTGGLLHPPDLSDPASSPAPFCHEWTRSFVYLPSKDKKSDTLIIFDRVNAEDPSKLERFDKYPAREMERVQGASYRKQWIIHCPQKPATPAANLVTWKTEGGQDVQVNTLLPGTIKRDIFDEKELWKGFNFCYETEKAFQVRLYPPQEQQWDTFLNIVQVFDKGFKPNNSLLRSKDATAAEAAVEGVLVHRGEAHPDAVVLFGAKKETRIIKTRYQVSFRSQASKTELLLCDLDTNSNWTIQVDGKDHELPVSDQGVGRFTIEGNAEHTIVVIPGKKPEPK